MATSDVSLAILPFENLSSTKEYDYFVVGLVEDLIVDLSCFHDLQIISSYTSTQLLQTDNALESARKIDISYLLRGSLLFIGETIRLNTQLIAAENGKIVWAERFESPVEEVFTVQSSVVERVVYAISSEVESTMLAAAREKPSTSLAAYDCFLRGMDKLRFGTLEADQDARLFFNKALELDPNYGRAYAGLSLSHFNEWSCQLWELYESSEEHAYRYAVQAYHLDDSDHVIQMILGRVYIYRRQFDQAEYHIERALELNRNDADNLVQLASCLGYLGRAAKGEELFKRALGLNPYRNLWYYQYGSFVYFVLRDFECSVNMALKRQLTNVWVDLPGFIASAYAQLGRKTEAETYLALFRDSFTKSITRGRSPEPQEIIEWLKRANPFKHKDDQDCLVDGLIQAGLKSSFSTRKEQKKVLVELPPEQSSGIFLKEDEIWRMEFEHVEITMLDIKGYHDIARLLGQPEEDIHCTELMGSVSSMDEKEYTIDEKAKQQYKQHLAELSRELEEAEEMNDLGRKKRLQQEMEQLLSHLEKDFGVGNRARKLKSPAERARAAVTLRIRGAIKKITEKHPTLGKHLSNSIRTGVFCRYSPEESREWLLHS